MNNSSFAVRRANKIAIFRQLLRMPEATKPELANLLRLSLPTVGQIVGELIEAGIVEENGRVASIGGRRAVAIRAIPEARLALGIDITKHHISFSVVDLAGKILAHERCELLFSQDAVYVRSAKVRLDAFLEKYSLSRQQLIGVGVSMPGIVSTDQSALVQSHAFHLKEPLRFPQLQTGTCPIHYFNDATAACMVECYAEDAPDSFVFLSLSNTVGGAMVVNKQIIPGQNGRNGELGHICIIPNGRMCYCGQRGHFDAYGAAWLLAEKTGGNLEAFFAGIAQGDPQLNAFFDEYLDYLALLVCNVVMMSDFPLIIGGYVGNYLRPYLPRLKKKVSDMDIFGQNDPDIRLCRYKEEAAATGSAMFFAEQFINHL